MFLVDSHCHLDGLDYESLHKDVDDVLAKAAARDVKFCLAVATTLPGYLHMSGNVVGKGIGSETLTKVYDALKHGVYVVSINGENGMKTNRKVCK